ncbi:diacylglycerol/lipid kinase family protein [Janibacter cremeus]|uniref:Diacylglycerol kinase family enzyme n=1 Tax=Janibacter cremeus TaxID=1285192 RepID=A0A852VN88_9MICO|nr:diacylglycerol kinase family protein [Janibacter cremeus]NYF98517.1 diacylglycerol kinase family enzyme [Janibacter cremeus]
MVARDALIVANPAARNGRARASVPGVADILRSHGWSVDIAITTCAEHAAEIAAAGEPDGPLLVALGGDGLVARVAEGAIRSGALVAPLPGGRGCDFIRAIGGSRDLHEAASSLPLATERRVDVGFAGATPFLGVATVGYDSRANDHANEAPAWLPAALVYAYGGARALAETRSTSITMTTDGVSRTFAGWSVAIGNSGRYGAGMIVNPGALLDDGELDITTVEGLPRWKYPMLLPRYFKGTHIDGIDIRAARGREIEVTAPVGQRVYADGDVVGRTPMTFTVEQEALRILV